MLPNARQPEPWPDRFLQDEIHGCGEEQPCGGADHSMHQSLLLEVSCLESSKYLDRGRVSTRYMQREEAMVRLNLATVY
jgi:hypothetical protein